MPDGSVLIQVAGDGLAPVIVDVTLKSVLLVITAGVVAGMARRASAAMRHQVWFIAVAGVLVLPVLSLNMPGWRVLPEWAGLPANAVRATETMGSRVSEARPAHSFSTKISTTTRIQIFVRENGYLILSGA